ncbi:MAG: ABC transporter ATP-binding protein [Pseudomonadota bacterium]
MSILDPVVKAENLTKRFKDLTAVDRISFEIRSGECFGFLGPNGAGKTSTIRMIYGFSPLTEGRLLVFGKEFKQHLREIKARIGVCQQENNLDPDLTVWENLLVYARYFNLPAATARQRAEEWLEFMGLAHKRQVRIPELSGGLMRRLVIARALIHNPDLLILDEPTTGLDPQSRHQVWEQLWQLKAKGLCILMTTHYMDEAEQICDRLVIMDQGRILVEGVPSALIQQHIGGNVIEVESPPPPLLDLLKAQKILYEQLPHRLLIHTREGEKLFRQISGEFCTSGCILRMATLEDVFLKFTGRGLRE